MRKVEYDFLNWTSFPSSLRIFNDEGAVWEVAPKVFTVQIKPGVPVTVKVKGKQENVPWFIDPGGLNIRSLVKPAGWNGKEWKYIKSLDFPSGSFDWKELTITLGKAEGITTDITALRFHFFGGGGTLDKPGITWFDDLKIYQDDVLIFSEDFSNWSPVIGAGVGAPIGGVAGYLLKEPLGPIVSEVVGAIVGGAVGGGIGLLAAIGVIPVPTLETAPFAMVEEAVPMAGKYMVRG